MWDALSFALTFLAVPLLGLASGIIYFRESGATAPAFRRVATSAYGPVIALMYLGMAIFFPNDFRYQKYLKVFWYALLIPVLLLAYSLMRYPGNKKVHVLAPFNILGLVWFFIVGTLAVGGE